MGEDLAKEFLTFDWLLAAGSVVLLLEICGFHVKHKITAVVGQITAAYLKNDVENWTLEENPKYL